MLSNLTMDDTYDSIEDISKTTSYRKGDISISDQLVDFERLRISALTKAAEISPFVKEVTIGPNSPIRKEENPNTLQENNHDKDGNKENLIEDILKEDFRYSLLIKEHEATLQETAEEVFINLFENMIKTRNETMRNYWKTQGEESERKTMELKRRKLQMLKQLQENDNVSVLEKARLDERNSQIINRQTIENLNKILEEQNKATTRFAAVTDSHTKICICYNEINSILQTEPGAKKVCENYITTIQTTVVNISKIMELCKSGNLSDKEVKQAEILVLNIENLKKKIIEDLQQIKQEELFKKQEEEAAIKQKELEEKKAQEAKAIEIAQMEKALLKHPKKSKPMFYSAKNYSYYEELRDFLDNYENKYKELLENVNLKKFRFDCQKAVNTPVNSISSVSGVHMKDKFDKLSKLLRGEKVHVLDTFVTVTQHPQGLYYCTALLAKKIVRQGDLLVSSNPEAAFPLAAVTVALSSQFPEFAKLLEAYFHRQCPYLVPMFLPQKEGQTDKEFYMSRGYTYNDEGVVEKQDKFLKRMSGIFRLQCAMWIANMPRFINAPNPHSIQYGWQWLASFINLKPESDICATLLHDFFIVCGSESYKFYGKQFTKVIKLITTEYFAILEQIDGGGPKTRLEVFLQNVLKTGHIPPPNGLLSPNVW